MIPIKNVLFRSNFCCNRRSISALYITGDKAKENYAVLHPYMNFAEVFNKTKEMEENIKIRNLNLNFHNINEKYNKFCKVENEKHNLETQREDIANKLKMNLKFVDKEKLQNLKNEGKYIREQLKALKDTIYPIEDDFINDFLHLPNKLHKRCPLNDNIQLIYRQSLPSLSNNNKISENHLNHTDLIDFKDNTCYYLLNEAAIFDLDFMHNCTEYFTQKNYSQMTNPDFARKILLEAAGVTNENAFEEIQEEIDLPTKINSLHLNGGGSFSSFLGFVSKLSIFPSVLPMKLISAGRQYYTNEKNIEKGLFTATQSNVVQVFVATETEQQADEEFDKLLNLYVDIYKKLGIHFQIIYEIAKNISSAESLRASVQMYSPYYGEYIEVGNLSHYSDFISKRILFNFKNGKKYEFPHIIGGTVINITKILGCLIENHGCLKSPRYCEQKSSAVDNFKDLFG